MLRARNAVPLTALRSLSTKVGFAFDIDGVLLHGMKPIPRAATALRLLQQEQIPFTLLTNGGGTLEAVRTGLISKLLDVDISPFQIVQSHTPFKALANVYNKILAVGQTSVREVAESYGFNKVVHAVDIIKYNEKIAPYSGISKQQLIKEARDMEDLATAPFDAVLVFNDPSNWGADLQIISDLLNSDRGLLNTKRDYAACEPSIPILFSHNDLFWSNGYCLNRFGQGALRMLVERLYSELNAGHPLEYKMLGKPTKLTYDFASQVLNNWDAIQKQEPWRIVSPLLGATPTTSQFDMVYMVGDNPASDIMGAYNYGWHSCLVRTGVYNDGDTLPCNPTMIVDDVLDAVTGALNYSTRLSIKP